MDNSQKKSRIILISIIAVIVLLIVGITTGIMMGTRMAGSTTSPAPSTVSKNTTTSQPQSSIPSQYEWHGKDIRKSGTGVYPGLDKEQACQKVGVEAAYWLTSGTNPQRYEELYKRFYLRGFPDGTNLDSTAHWVNHGEPPYTAVSVTLNQLGTFTPEDDAIGCVISLDGQPHDAGDRSSATSSDPKPGALYLELDRHDKDSPWYVLHTQYNSMNYQRDIKTQGND